MTKFLETTRERFLLAIAAELPAERFIELHFFHPIRQSGIESGVAVIAAYPEVQPEVVLADAPPVEEPVVLDDLVVLSEAPPVILSEAPPVILSEAKDLLLDQESEQQILRRSAPQDDREGVVPQDDRGSRSAPQDDRDGVVPQDDRGSRSAPQDDNAEGVASRDEKTRRYTVYSARYKLVLKGPDRGKWEFTLVAEADAPLVTVESVVRGVMRRSGDAEEPERMSGDEARAYLLTPLRSTIA